jgi:serine phosphatase RsbU (regulator of sigma subunit)
MERDLEIARSIQQALLPADRPQVPGFDVAGETAPADLTGGDYFGWFPLAEGRQLVTIADVTGHGIGPALLTTNLHAYLQALALDGAGLADWVARLNGHLSRDLREGRFVTFAAAVLRPADDAVEVLSAGHGPILLYSAGEDRVAEWRAQGPPLGVVPNFQFDEPGRPELRAGDILALLTDGFSEWTNAQGEPYGMERLKESLQLHRALGADEIIKALRRDVETFASGSTQSDDLTVVVVKRTTDTAP